jgi:hypothetical protein
MDVAPRRSHLARRHKIATRSCPSTGRAGSLLLLLPLLQEHHVVLGLRPQPGRNSLCTPTGIWRFARVRGRRSPGLCASTWPRAARYRAPQM